MPWVIRWLMLTCSELKLDTPILRPKNKVFS